MKINASAKLLLQRVIVGYLETCTFRGQRLARPAQLRADAKKMAQANRIPMRVLMSLHEMALVEDKTRLVA